MPNTVWPDDLIQIAANKSLVLFVGSGVSASCKNSLNESPPTWNKLLERLAKAIKLDSTDKKKFTMFKELLESHRLLDAAELLKYSANDQGRTGDLTNAFKSAVQGPRGCHFLPSGWHESIGEIDPSIIITTNYDKILESANGFTYTPLPYTSDEIGSQIRKNEPTIIKLHGSIDEPSKTILTRSDYARLHRYGSTTLDIVRALMWTRTFLFVGYSLSDPDLQALLQDVFAARWSENVSPHYILTSDATSDHDKEMFRYCYGISTLTYDRKLGDYGLTAFQEFGKQVSATPPH